MSGLSSSTRGVFAGGYDPGAKDMLEYVTIASQGNVIDYGDLVSTKFLAAATSNSVRGIVASKLKRNYTGIDLSKNQIKTILFFVN